MAFDPTVPAVNADLDATPVRDNFNALKGLIDAIPALPGNFVQFYLQETDPIGKDGDLWFQPIFQTLKIKIAGTWINLAGGAEIGLGTFQPAVGHPYRTTTGNDGGTDTLANAIANNWNVEDGLLKP